MQRDVGYVRSWGQVREVQSIAFQVRKLDPRLSRQSPARRLWFISSRALYCSHKKKTVVMLLIAPTQSTTDLFM